MNRLSVAAAVLCAFLIAPFGATAAEAAVQVPVAGTVISGESFTGTMTITRFAVKDGAVVAIGTVSGVLKKATTTISVIQNISVPTTVTGSSCDILHLELGPLSLDLLGLQVDLNKVVLDIVAQTGAGNLLGNLLCAVTGLLDNPSGLAKLLNQILAILG